MIVYGYLRLVTIFIPSEESKNHFLGNSLLCVSVVKFLRPIFERALNHLLRDMARWKSSAVVS